MYKNNLEIVILNKKNITDFAEERNNILNNSNKQWVFYLDSDEIASEELKNEILKKISSNNKSGFYIFRKNYFLGNYVGTDKILRVVKKDSGKWFRKVHEKFIPYDQSGMGIINTPLIHNTTQNLYGYINKIQRYAKMHAAENMNEGKSSSLFKIIFYPAVKFCLILAKSRNVVFSIMQSLHSFLAWSEIWLIQKK